MSVKINPPAFKAEKSYERYRQELSAWREITDIEDKKQGIVVALSLPEEDSTHIREKVFEELSISELTESDGLSKLLSFMDKHLAKDELEDILEKFELFEDLMRNKGQSISEYTALFDQLYNKIKNKGINLPPVVLAFKLLRRANLTKEEKLLVLTGMDYSNKDSLYDQAIVSLKKFLGDGSVNLKQRNEGASMNIKVEETYANWTPQRYVRGYTRYPYRENTRGRRGNFRGRERDRRPINPQGQDGRTMTCSACGSYRHLVKFCPHSYENMAAYSCEHEENVVLFTEMKGVTRLGLEARGCIVLDSACSGTVCGKEWLETYLSTLPLKEQDSIKQNKRISHKVFRFGGGEKCISQGSFDIPATLAGKQVTIRTDVVDSDIPLLWSKDSMKAAKVKMDLENDSAEILGQKVPLNETSSGHYCVPISDKVSDVNAVILEKLTDEELRKTLLKLHRQFAHPPSRKLASLLKDAGVWRPEYGNILDELSSKCDLCRRYSPTPPRPAVALPMADHFNQTVSMDLKRWNNRWILHIIDMQCCIQDLIKVGQVAQYLKNSGPLPI